MEHKSTWVQKSSLEVYSACSQAVQSLPRIWQGAFCLVCYATSHTHHPALSSNPINTSIWGRSDDLVSCVCDGADITHTHTTVDEYVYFLKDLYWDTLTFKPQFIKNKKTYSLDPYRARDSREEMCIYRWFKRRSSTAVCCYCSFTHF